MWAFLLSPVGRLVGIGALSALLAGFGSYEVTAAFKDRTIAQMRLADAQSVNDAWKIGWLRRDVQDQATEAANKANQTDQHKLTENTQEVIRYVPKYITVHDDAACVLPDNFGRVLDAAQLGTTPDQLPAGTGLPVGSPPRYTLSEATGLLTQILGDYASVRARLINADQNWKDEAAKFDKPPIKAP